MVSCLGYEEFLKKRQSPVFDEDLSINRKDLVFDIGDRIHPLFLSPFFFRESGYNEKKNREMIKDT